MFGGLFAGAKASAPKEPWETGQAASDILRTPTWPAEFPLNAQHLKRLDESPDTRFYSQPRVNVQHIDDYAIATLGKHYAGTLPKGGVVLDLMSSWTSHLAAGSGKDTSDGFFQRVSGLGMHADELKAKLLVAIGGAGGFSEAAVAV